MPMKKHLLLLATIVLSVAALVIAQDPAPNREVLQLRLELAQRDKLIANLQYKQAPCDWRTAEDSANAAQKALADLDKSEKEKASAKVNVPEKKGN